MTPKPLLPVYISVPHGGLWVPPEVKPYCRLDLPAILKDGDTWTYALYNLKGRVLAYARFPVARAVVDVNRAAGDRPPDNPDGVVKTVTVDNEPVWADPQGLSPEQVERLLERYYEPYHRRLSRASQNRNILLGLDCHTMLNRAPSIASRPSEQRPLVCLSNGGDERGEALDGEAVTAPPSLLRALGKALERQLEDKGLEMGVPVVWLNRPFRGGHIIQRHGSGAGQGYGDGYDCGGGHWQGCGCPSGNEHGYQHENVHGHRNWHKYGHDKDHAHRHRGSRPLPWIQVEFNRALYLRTEPVTAKPPGEVVLHLNDLRRRFVQALETLFQ